MEDTYAGNDPFAEESQLNMDVELNSAARALLLETAKWAKFLAILGFVGIGLMVLAALFMGFAFSNMPSGLGMMYGGLGGGGIAAIYLVIAAVYFFPVWYLLNFANKTKLGLETFDTHLFTEGLSNLKSHYKFVGIFAIIVMGLYVLILIGAVFSAMALG